MPYESGEMKSDALLTLAVSTLRKGAIIIILYLY